MCALTIPALSVLYLQCGTHLFSVASDSNPNANPNAFKRKRRTSHLAVAVQGGEVEEERLSQRDGVDGVVHVVTVVQLHLLERGRHR